MSIEPINMRDQFSEYTKCLEDNDYKNKSFFEKFTLFINRIKYCWNHSLFRRFEYADNATILRDLKDHVIVHIGSSKAALECVPVVDKIKTSISKLGDKTASNELTAISKKLQTAISSDEKRINEMLNTIKGNKNYCDLRLLALHGRLEAGIENATMTYEQALKLFPEYEKKFKELNDEISRFGFAIDSKVKLTEEILQKADKIKDIDEAFKGLKKQINQFDEACTPQSPGGIPGEDFISDDEEGGIDQPDDGGKPRSSVMPEEGFPSDVEE